MHGRLLFKNSMMHNVQCIKNLLPVSASVPLYRGQSTESMHPYKQSSAARTACWDLQTANRTAAGVHFLGDERFNTFQVLFSIF